MFSETNSSAGKYCISSRSEIVLRGELAVVTKQMDLFNAMRIQSAHLFTNVTSGLVTGEDIDFFGLSDDTESDTNEELDSDLEEVESDEDNN